MFKGVVDTISSLYEEWKSSETKVTYSEFIGAKLEQSPMEDEVVKMFLDFCKHQLYLELVQQNFFTFLKKRKKTNVGTYSKSIRVQVILYLAIFELDTKNSNEFLNCLGTMRQWGRKSMIYLKDHDNLIEVVQAACRFFSNDYVLDRIIDKLIANENVFESGIKSAKHLKPQREEIKFKVPACYQIKKPREKPDEPVHETKFKSQPVPKNVHEKDTSFAEKLAAEKAKNHEKAMELLRLAKENMFKCAEVKPKPEPAVEIFQQPAAKPAPKFQEVNVKKTYATVIREAALLMKEREAECKRIEELISGGMDSAKYNEIEFQIRLEQQQHNIQEIERKHLEGLLSREEAILSKRKLIKANQVKMCDYQEERIKLLEEIENFRIAEEEKNKAAIEKVQNIEEARKEAEAKLLKTKQGNVRLIEHETKQLLQEAYRKKQEELSKRILLIQELKALHQLSKSQPKEFDRTECPNLGLMCEMSIAELQERLYIMRLKLDEDLRIRKERIAKDREAQRNYIQCMEDFIANNKKEEPVEQMKVTLQQTPDIMDLKNRLQQVKMLNSLK